MSRLLFTIIFLGTLLQVNGRELRGTVTGQSGEPVEFVSVGIFAPGATKPVALSVTDSLGRFGFDDIAGATVLKATLAGMEEAVVEIGGEREIAVVMNRKSKQLDEVTVTAGDRITNGRTVTYLPAKTVKTASAGGFELLDGMALDNVTVDVLDKKIETAWGEGIAVFINNLPATANDVQNILPADVKKVEYIDFPTDIRFRGNHRVINIILDAYNLGGYTKLTAGQYVVNNRGDYGLASKLTYKSMTYDLAAGYGYRKSSRNNHDYLKIFDFGDREIKRTEKSDFSRDFSENPYATLRMVYGSDKASVSNTVGFSFDHSPGSDSRGTVDFSSVYPSGRFSRSARSQAATPSWSGDYYFALPRGYTLMVSGNASYTRRHSNTRYSADDNGAIVNNAVEDAWYVKGLVAANRQFGIFNVGYDVLANTLGNNLDYNGTTPSHSRMRKSTVNTSPSVDFNIGEVGIYATLRFNYQQTAINDKKSEDFWVNPYVALFWNPSNKLSTQLSLFRQVVSYSVDQRSPDIVRRSEIEWIAGNPDLKNYFNDCLMLSARYNLSRTMTLGFNLQFSKHRNTAVYRWTPSTDGEGRPVMIQSYTNNGSFTSTTPTLSLTGRFLKRSLVTSLSVRPTFYRQSGQRHLDTSILSWTAGVTYYKSKFNVGARYSSPGRFYSAFMETINRESYNIFVGYSHKNLVVRAYAINFLSDSWKGGRSVTDGDIYYNLRQNYSSSAHRNFMFTLTYSLSYGKKVKADEALKRVEATQSGILK